MSSIELTVEFKRETEKAYLVSDTDIETWLPKSQVIVKKEYHENEINYWDIEIPEWLVLSKGFI